jgi:RimJ/RimL family protein N-acetyltransferase
MGVSGGGRSGHGRHRIEVRPLAPEEWPTLRRVRLRGHSTLEDNHRARQVYERLGFEPTGERQELPVGEGLVEERLRLPISNGRCAD